MVAYVFRAENTVTKKTYIGKYFSVRFDKKYIGNDPGVLADAEKYGADKFIVNMIVACETVKDCEMAYSRIIKDNNATTDESFYNCEKKITSKKATEVVEDAPVEKPKKTRKKKVVEE